MVSANNLARVAALGVSSFLFCAAPGNAIPYYCMDEVSEGSHLEQCFEIGNPPYPPFDGSTTPPPPGSGGGDGDGDGGSDGG